MPLPVFSRSRWKQPLFRDLSVASAAKLFNRNASAGASQRETVTANLDARSFESTVSLFHRVRNVDAGALFKLGFVADDVLHDWSVRSNDNLLFAALIPDGDHRTIHARNGGAHF